MSKRPVTENQKGSFRESGARPGIHDSITVTKQPDPSSPTHRDRNVNYDKRKGGYIPPKKVELLNPGPLNPEPLLI